MKLNLGCGEFYAEGWTNVDLASPHRKDITHDLRQPLPFESGAVDVAYLGHVLEHLTLDDCARLLADLRDKLHDGSPVLVVGPDCDRAADMLIRGDLDRETFTGIRYGAGRWAGDEHLWRCEPQQVATLLREAGYRGVREIPITSVGADWPVTSRVGWQCAVEAAA